MILTGGRGYEYVYEPNKPKSQARKIALHRLVAYAHGELEALDEPLEIDHINRCRWDNRPDNLQALETDEHARITNARRAAQCD